MGFGIVQDVGASSAGALLKVRRPGETFYIVVASRPPAGAASAIGRLTVEEKRQAAPGRLPPGIPRDARIERALESAHVVGAEGSTLWLEKDGVRVLLSARAGKVHLEAPRTDAEVPTEVATVAALAQAGTEQLRILAGEALALRQRELRAAISKGLAKVKRRAAAVRTDLERMAAADGLLSKAQWLLAEAARAPRGATTLRGTDWSTGEGVTIELAIDPAKSAKEQIAAMFRRAQRLKLGRRFAEPRLAAAEASVTTLTDALARLRDAKTFDELEALARLTKASAPRDVVLSNQSGGGAASPISRGRNAPERASAYRTFSATHGARVFVGKGGAHNDELTLHVARPHDLWLHAKNQKGAHVVVPLLRGKSCPGEVLVDAAHLAAHFSDARGERTVEIEYTDRRHVRKPKGSAPGLVVVGLEKVLILRVDDARITRLLEAEQS